MYELILGQESPVNGQLSKYRCSLGIQVWIYNYFHSLSIYLGKIFDKKPTFIFSVNMSYIWIYFLKNNT